MFAYTKTVLQNRPVITALAWRAFTGRFAGTAGGFAWMIVQPLLMVAAYWVVFTYGFKVTAANNMPFAVYFVTGLLPWTMFSDVLNATTTAVSKNGFLVRKVRFPSEILPLTEITAAAIPHSIFFILTLLVLLGHGYVPGWWMLQLPYAFCALMVLSLGFGFLLSSLNVFHRDIGQFVSAITGIWFWLTPLVWHLDMLPAPWRQIATLNPFLHVVEAYRAALIYERYAWHAPLQTAAFWIMALLLLLLGHQVFMRLKREFVDVM